MAKSRERAGTTPKSVESLVHDEGERKNIPTAEYSAMHGRKGEELKLRYHPCLSNIAIKAVRAR